MSNAKSEKILIDKSLFFDLYHLALQCPNPSDPAYNRAIQGCQEKLDRMIDHFFYSMYKICPSPEIRALAREKYLDRIGCPEDNRWTNAVARKLAIALYYMQSSGQPFSYEKYNLIKDVVIVDITIDKLAVLNPEFRRYINPLRNSGIMTTSDLIHKYYACELRHTKGLGKKFFGLIKDFIQNQKLYKQRLEEV